MAREPRTVITIDVGTAYARVLVAEVTAAGELHIQGRGEAPSIGVQRGIVTNVDDASFAIRAALEDAGVAGRSPAKITQVYASVGGKHLSFINHYGEVKVHRSDRLVTERDVLAALAASRITPADDQAALHAIPRNFRVDGYMCRRNPIGMYGSAVGADTHVVIASAGAARSLRKAVLMAGKDITALVANPVASAQAVLTAQEKEAGVILVDIGAGATDIIAYSGGAPFHTSVMPIGGNQIANDLAVALNTSFPVAERLYREHGAGSSEGLSATDELTVACFGLTGTRTLRRTFLNEVIKLRLVELLRLAYVQARSSAPDLPLAAGVVITGGVAHLPKMEVLAAEALQAPVRVGVPQEYQGLPAELLTPSWATMVGALRLALEPTSDLLKARPPETARLPFAPMWQALRARAKVA